MRAVALVLTVAATAVVSCGSSAPTSTSGPSGTPSRTAAPASSLPIPADFREACRLESSVCSGDFATSGPFPADLARPLALPSVPAGAPCPVSAGHPITTSAFGGLALGEGPARPLAAARDVDAARGIPLDAPYQGWLSFKTLWFTDPSYQGPVRIRGPRIDAPGEIAFGEGPDQAELIIPPGPTVNGRDGYREAPGGTYVRAPRCYAWQVDGVGFSPVIVFRAIAA
jgi:hypothetical protein